MAGIPAMPTAAWAVPSEFSNTGTPDRQRHASTFPVVTGLPVFGSVTVSGWPTRLAQVSKVALLEKPQEERMRERASNSV